MITLMITVIYGALLTAQLGLYGTATYRLRRSLMRSTVDQQLTAPTDLPSVSVCIPARNETHAMTQCLERVLLSDYRKLEVIVYDDSSVDDTSILIRSFAHAGVRFVPGGPLPEGWLGKNHALEVLSREASGTYVLFLDVDTIIQPTTISQLVDHMSAGQMAMTSVIPGRINTLRASVLFGHLRYFWQLVLDRPHAPASSSSLWIISRRVLLDTIGGFASHKDAVEPESQMAALIGPRAYRCLVSNAKLGVDYEKKWSSQAETSRRLLYPAMGGQWLGGMLGMAALLLMNAPTAVLVSALWTGWSVEQTVSLVVLAGYGLLYATYTRATWRRWWPIGGLLWPVVVLLELLLATSSVIGYARRTITWKGRLVRPNTKPVAHTPIT